MNYSDYLKLNKLIISNMKNEVYKVWYDKNKVELLKKRKEEYRVRKKILENIRFYQRQNDIELEEVEEDHKLFICSTCNFEMLYTSKCNHLKSKYHKSRIS